MNKKKQFKKSKCWFVCYTDTTVVHRHEKTMAHRNGTVACKDIKTVSP